MATSTLTPEIKAAFSREIIEFLKYCKVVHSPATVELAKQYLARREAEEVSNVVGRQPVSARVALRWFYQEGKRSLLADGPAAPVGPPRIEDGRASGISQDPGQRRSLQPPLAAQDLGGALWEKELIKTMRERGLLWRSEQTYREWAVRFARFIAPRSPYAASGEDVAAFLSALAVESRASPSTQKQALNALVFLMQEALHRDLGQMNFKRAYPKKRLPTVLSLAETRSVFAQMDGTSRLMAELAYGSGLRLMELLRLRVHHPDLERQRLQVFGGKGDRVYGFADAVTRIQD